MKSLKSKHRGVGASIKIRKCGHVLRQAHRDRFGQKVTIGEFYFERVNNFKHLGAVITAENYICEEIKVRIQSSITCMFALSKLLKSGHATTHGQLRIYKTIIRHHIMMIFGRSIHTFFQRIDRISSTITWSSSGRPRPRWRDNILKDLPTIGRQYFTDLIMNRNKWRWVVQSAKSNVGL